MAQGIADHHVFWLPFLSKEEKEIIHLTYKENA